MKINGKTQIPNIPVYIVLYSIVFGVSIWILITDPEGPTNWVLYVLMLVSVLMAAIHFAVYRFKQRETA